MSNLNTNLKVGFPSIWAPTDQKAPLCVWAGNKPATDDNFELQIREIVYKKILEKSLLAFIII